MNSGNSYTTFSIALKKGPENALNASDLELIMRPCLYSGYDSVLTNVSMWLDYLRVGLPPFRSSLACRSSSLRASV